MAFACRGGPGERVDRRRRVSDSGHASRSERSWKGKLDVITVFDAKSGEVLEQIDTATMIVDMAVFGKDLALTTSEGLRFIALKK